MKFRGPIPILYVNDLQKTIDYYRDILGFEVNGSYPAEKRVWASMAKDLSSIMFSTLTNINPKNIPPQLTGTLYFYPENIDAYWEEIRNKADVVYPIENFHYGMREFGVRDINGYVLCFGAEVKK